MEDGIENFSYGPDLSFPRAAMMGGGRWIEVPLYTKSEVVHFCAVSFFYASLEFFVHCSVFTMPCLVMKRLGLLMLELVSR